MSLGAFGGYVIFKFANPVENHPDNPFGVDFTIFGNPLDEWSEQGIVSVMKDENGNGLPDDTWYELAGSEYFFSSTIKNYEVTYTNPNEASAADVPWTDNQGDSGAVLANGFHTQPYYPLADSFPDVASNEYSLGGTRVADEVDRTIPTYIKSYRKAFGYVDNQLRGSAPYTVPDNPYTPEKENSGGDAFDISWAVDSNGEYVDLDEIHFVKVHNAVLADAGWLGEVSTEVTGAFDVAPNDTVTGELDFLHFKELPDTVYTNMFTFELFAYYKGRWQEDREIDWNFNREGISVNKDNMVFTQVTGDIELTAAIADNPAVSASANTYVKSLEIQTKIKDVKVNENSPDSIIGLSGLFEDPDDGQAEITTSIVTGYNDTIVSAAINDNNLTLSFLKTGATHLMIKGSANGKIAYFQFVVAVNAADGPVIANPIMDIAVNKGANDTSINLLPVFTIDGYNDTLIMKSIASNTNEQVVEASVQENMLQLHFLSPGNTTLVVEGMINDKSTYTSFQVTVNSIMEIDNNKPQQKDICIYPNPASDYVKIRGACNATIIMYNMAGYPVLQVKGQSQEELLQISNLRKGVYIIRVIGESQNIVFRLIKQ